MYRQGYPSAFVFESIFENYNPYIHTPLDTKDRLDYRHMLEFVKLVVGFVEELAFAEDI